jgi:hypothetical protein
MVTAGEIKSEVEKRMESVLQVLSHAYKQHDPTFDNDILRSKSY